MQTARACWFLLSNCPPGGCPVYSWPGGSVYMLISLPGSTPVNADRHFIQVCQFDRQTFHVIVLNCISLNSNEFELFPHRLIGYLIFSRPYLHTVSPGWDSESGNRATFRPLLFLEGYQVENMAHKMCSNIFSNIKGEMYMIKETHYNLRAIIILLNKGKNSKIYQREEKKYISENTLIR